MGFAESTLAWIEASNPRVLGMHDWSPLSNQIYRVAVAWWYLGTWRYAATAGLRSGVAFEFQQLQRYSWDNTRLVLDLLIRLGIGIGIDIDIGNFSFLI